MAYRLISTHSHSCKVTNWCSWLKSFDTICFTRWQAPAVTLALVWGVVELTVALHHVFNTPHDRIVWDVGHQTYPHKILTGRRDRMNSMRQIEGLSGFPKRSESPFDTFGVGHSSTSISAAMGMALAAQKQGIDRKVVAVIGDGAITGGMAFEALAHAGHERPNMLVILNDNQMSIGHNTGGLATYFAKIWASKTYIALREGSKKNPRACSRRLGSGQED